MGHVGHGSVHWWVGWVMVHKMWPNVSSALQSWRTVKCVTASQLPLFLNKDKQVLNTFRQKTVSTVVVAANVLLPHDAYTTYLHSAAYAMGRRSFLVPVSQRSGYAHHHAVDTSWCLLMLKTLMKIQCTKLKFLKTELVLNSIKIFLKTSFTCSDDKKDNQRF